MVKFYGLDQYFYLSLSGWKFLFSILFIAFENLNITITWFLQLEEGISHLPLLDASMRATALAPSEILPSFNLLCFNFFCQTTRRTWGCLNASINFLEIIASKGSETFYLTASKMYSTYMKEESRAHLTFYSTRLRRTSLKRC